MHQRHLILDNSHRCSKSIINADFPVIRTHINPNQVRLELDPEHQEDSMVHILGREGAATGIPLIVEEMPEESYFIAQNRANIPAARGPLVNTSGRALGATGSRGTRGSTRERARGARGASRAKGAIETIGTIAAGRKRTQEDGHQEEFQSTQGAPRDDA